MGQAGCLPQLTLIFTGGLWTKVLQFRPDSGNTPLRSDLVALECVIFGYGLYMFNLDSC